MRVKAVTGAGGRDLNRRRKDFSPAVGAFEGLEFMSVRGIREAPHARINREKPLAAKRAAKVGAR